MRRAAPPLAAQLRARFKAPEWALFFEVADSTGFAGQGRYLDAVAMCLYPSKGLELHGVEVKASRSDLLRELRDPSKAEAVARHCDRFWLATPREGVVKDPAELPVGWGWLRLSKDGSELRVAKRAPQMMSRAAEDPVEKQFVAALLRRAAEAMAVTPEATALEAARNAGRRDALATAKSNRDYELERAVQEARRAKDRSRELEALVGARGWDSVESLRRRMDVAAKVESGGLVLQLKALLASLESIGSE